MNRVMTKKKSQAHFITGIPELLILRLLSEREMYGYEVVREIQTRTTDILKFEEGGIYPILHSLEKDEYIDSRKKRTPQGRNRIYYRLTPKGRTRLMTMAERWELVTDAIKGVLIRKGGQHVPGTI